MHFDDKKGGDKGGSSGQSNICECKHADWYSYGYCNVGTTSGDVKGCQQAYMVCCGWAKVGAFPRTGTSALLKHVPHTFKCVYSRQLKSA